MPLLDQQQYNRVIELGKAAVTAIKNNDVETFIRKANEGWDEFPEPKDSWNQGYNYAKMIFKHLLEHRKFDEAETWLGRMMDNNNTLHNFDGEVTFYEGKLYFEKGDYKNALPKWQEVVKESGFRYFETENPEYINFYNNPSAFINQS